MKKTTILALALALSVSSGCNAEQNSNIQHDVSNKKTISVTCYSGTMVTYKHDVILIADIFDKELSARVQEVDTGIKMRIPISQCYFKDN